MASAATGRVLVYGGKGALGSICVSYFKAKQWWVTSVDVAANDEADSNVTVQPDASWIEQASEVVSNVEKALEGQKLDAVLCVAGGWVGGNAASKDFIKNCDISCKQSLWSSAIASQLACKFMKEGGLLTLTGAKAALEGTPSMIGYGVAKAAVHHLTKSLADPKGGLPQSATVLAILPITLDTPMNRKWMPNADFTTWTSLDFVAELLHKWSTGAERPNTGSLVQLETVDSVTKLIVS